MVLVREKCTEISFKFFASFFFGRFRKTKARIEFWAQSENSQLVYELYALKNEKPQLAYKVEVVNENN